MLGTIMGTAGYMSPEKAKGKPVDKRADIFAFGVVLYEMATGERLFQGETVSESLASIIKEEPNWTRVPARLQRLLHKCLEKDPKKRLRDIADWPELLDGEERAPASSRPQTGTAGWIAAGVFALLSVGLAYVHLREKPTETGVIRSSIPAPENTAFGSFQGGASPSAPLAATAGSRSGCARWTR
jgi:serine/threonine-protein kinase